MANISKDILKSGEMTGIKADGKSILVANIKGKYYAMEDICPHIAGRCNLHKGTLNDKEVKCPCHGTTFDVTTGKILLWIPDWPDVLGKATQMTGMARDLKTYKCEVKGDKVSIEIGAESEKSDKNRLILLFLCIFFGWIGAHRFYANKVFTGFLMMFTMGGFGIWVFIDLVMIAAGKFKDKDCLTVTKWF